MDGHCIQKLAGYYLIMLEFLEFSLGGKEKKEIES
jgi:hypothetical protein